MDFALLGIDALTRPLVEAIAGHSAHRLLAAADVGSDAAWLSRLAPEIEVHGDWSLLLGSTAFDVVIVASSENDDRRAEQLRRFAQDGATLLVAHPVVESLLIYYELDMIRQDSGCRIIPLLPARLHGEVRRLASAASRPEDAEIGAVQQLVIDRTVSDPAARRVIGCFARDVDLAAAICGDLTEISAMSSGASPGDYANLSVQMRGTSGIVVRWSVAGVDADESARLTLRGQRGQAVFDLPEDVAGRRDQSAAVLECFGRQGLQSRELPAWKDAVRAMELADSVEISLRRGRTIQLHHGQASEESTFKGMMASAGCGLLLLGLLATFAGLLLIWLEVPGAGVWPYALLGLFVLFLLMQLLKLVFARDRT